MAKKSYAEAEAAFQEVLKADEADPNGFFAMGALREAQGNAADARMWFEKAAAADPLWTRPLMRLAALATSAGDRASATRHLSRVVDLDPASSDGKKAADLLKTP